MVPVGSEEQSIPARSVVFRLAYRPLRAGRCSGGATALIVTPAREVLAVTSVPRGLRLSPIGVLLSAADDTVCR